MIRKIIWGIMFSSLLIGTSEAQTQAPKPFGPLPNENQMRWQEMEYYAFLHFSINTFTDQEWGGGDEDARLFNPKDLDCRQWARVCKDAGMKGIILTVKHHCGFCLWPSKYTGFSVKNSPWKDGKGDVVRELSDACKEYGLKLGIYLSPWDRNSADYGKPEYITYFRNQLTELLTNYGPIFEVWFDGANGGSGYYGGARETRKIDPRTYYDWQNTYKLIRKLQPDIVIWNDGGDRGDLRWVGTEAGYVGETNWSLLNATGEVPEDMLRYGVENGDSWVPGEVNTSIRPGWFYHTNEDNRVKTLPQLMNTFYSSIGRNGTLLLNFPIDTRGLINENDVKASKDFAAAVKETFDVNLTENSKVSASNVRGNSKEFGAEKAIDGNKDTYWATDDEVINASMIVDFGKPTTFNRFLVQEYIRLGQRVKAFTVEGLVEGKWKELAKATTIGYKRILLFPTVSATQLRFNITDSKSCPVISNIGIFNAPEILTTPSLILAQNSSDKSNYQQVNTYVNPVLPGDHPDPTLLKVGDDFYHCGSSFHFTPYMPVYHSKDLVHWEVIGRVLPPSKAGWVSDRPSEGIWQGAITYFYGSYWIYFSSNGQWFCKSDSPAGPWSDPVEVKTNPVTGPLGYDNSIFIDDDGTPYMVIKNGQKINRIQALGHDGQLKGTVINLDWINAKLQYSWAEGPVMCKRNGYYFYFPAGDVSGGQYVLRAKELTADSTKWERLGIFFKPETDPDVGFHRPNHMSAPVLLADGTWWTIAQSYEIYNGDDWSGKGRQTSLYQVVWEGDRPWGVAPTTEPLKKPNLPQAGILWRSVQSDEFESIVLSPNWHFMSKRAAASYSLTARKGWIRLTPETERTHLLQKETDHYYTAVTRVDLDANDSTAKGGIYLTNGNQRVIVRLYTGYNDGKKIIFALGKEIRSIPNKSGNSVWLKLERNEHRLSGFCSSDGNTWESLGDPISAVNLDKVQPNYNSWVGTSVGLFAEGKPADFDFFICKDGFSSLPAAGYSNYFGVKTIKKESEKVVTNTSSNGGWLMISGVELGKESPSAVELAASSIAKGEIEIWLDDLKDGKLIATVPVSETGGEMNLKTFSKDVKNVSGHHDVFIKFPTGKEGTIYIKSLRFLK